MIVGSLGQALRARFDFSGEGFLRGSAQSRLVGAAARGVGRELESLETADDVTFDGDVAGLDAGQVGLHHPRLVGFLEVHWRRPHRRGLQPRAAQHVGEEPVHPLSHLLELAKRIPAGGQGRALAGAG